MSASLAVTITVLLSVALIGGLTYVMSLALRLTPHVPCAKAAASPVKEPALLVSTDESVLRESREIALGLPVPAHS